MRRINTRAKRAPGILIILLALPMIVMACSNRQGVRNTPTFIQATRASIMPSLSSRPTSTATMIVSPTLMPSLVQQPLESRLVQTSTSAPTKVEFTSTPTLDPILEAVMTSTPDLQLIVTRTPAPPRTCPEESIAAPPTLPEEESGGKHSSPEAILDYLNAGGSPTFLQTSWQLAERTFVQRDVTGDGVPEVLIRTTGFNIYMCNGGFYESVLWIPSNNPGITPWIITIDDMNLDGIPEVAILDFVMSAQWSQYFIYEWNGDEFELLSWPSENLYAWYYTPKGRGLNWYSFPYPLHVPIQRPEIEGLSSIAEILDLDENGTKEFIVHTYIPPPSLLADGPWRETVNVYRWNGRIFLLDEFEISAPEYRFQAIQDGDRMSFLGNYAKALDLYQQAIFSDELAAWSYDNYIARMYVEWETPIPPTPTRIPYIQDEYNNLAAYARYRIMLLHILQGDKASAKIVYYTLRERYADDQTGGVFVEMSDEFWSHYQATDDVHTACSAVIQFADMKKEDLFAYLGGTLENPGAYGIQSHIYTSWDMCPY